MIEIIFCKGQRFVHRADSLLIFYEKHPFRISCLWSRVLKKSGCCTEYTGNELTSARVINMKFVIFWKWKTINWVRACWYLAGMCYLSRFNVPALTFAPRITKNTTETDGKSLWFCRQTKILGKLQLNNSSGGRHWLLSQNSWKFNEASKSLRPLSQTFGRSNPKHTKPRF